MTEGISKETILQELSGCPFPERVYELTRLLDKCKEINPWIPIDENTPKDRRLLLHAGEPVIGWFDNIKNVWRSTDSKKLYPTHYQELPDDPK